MQGLIALMRSLFRFTWRISIVYVVFLLLAWVLLGMHPREGATTTYNRIRGVWHWVTGFAGDVKEAGVGMKEMGERHLKGAQDRFHGIDPYEEYNNKLNQNLPTK